MNNGSKSLTGAMDIQSNSRTTSMAYIHTFANCTSHTRRASSPNSFTPLSSRKRFITIPNSRIGQFSRHISKHTTKTPGKKCGLNMRWSGGGESVPPADRALAILPYLIPLLDSLSFGKYVFAKVPILNTILLQPLVPLYSLYRGVPFLAFGVFLALFVLVVRNTNISRFVRFNTYQALILDIALIFPQLFQNINLGSVIPAGIAEVCTTAIFYGIMLAVTYATVMNTRGKLPDEIPAVSESVKQQLGPF